jgi:hypothetical protein
VFPISLRPSGGGGGQLDQVVGEDRGPAIRDVRLVNEDDANAAGGRAKPNIDLRRDVLDDPGQPTGQRLLTLVIMNVEAAHAEGAELQPRVVSKPGYEETWLLRGHTRRGCGQHHQHDQDPSRPPRTCASHHRRSTSFRNV